jgi:hypothetical protein
VRTSAIGTTAHSVRAGAKRTRTTGRNKCGIEV